MYKMGFMVGLLAVSFLLGCSGAQGSDSYTLYRNSILDPSMRIHVATFDAADGRSYNSENCAIAQSLFKSQSGVRTVFWCELGEHKK